jgi:predicted O-methyltransferase YrrM
LELILDKALSIQGWMDHPDLQWLAEKAKSHKYIVEIGCWLGRSTRALADNTDGVVYAVDTWGFTNEEPQRKILEGKPEDWLFDEFLRNMKFLSNVRVSRKYSIDAANDFKNMKFDMIFIDGSHDYENIKKDIMAWYPLLEENGLFCGHDVLYPDIEKALKELFPHYARVAGAIWRI